MVARTVATSAFAPGSFSRCATATRGLHTASRNRLHPVCHIAYVGMDGETVTNWKLKHLLDLVRSGYKPDEPWRRCTHSTPKPTTVAKCAPIRDLLGRPSVGSRGRRKEVI
ncbi:MAG: hypothetical protein IPN95_30300 [Bacteroidetes bacterium]|nr:hypothetical protein [Bacteroidota bacterium]